VANGEKLFTSEKCSNCHGAKGKAPGSAKTPNLWKVKWDDHEYEEAFETVKKGKTPMPAYADKLQDKQIADIVAFLKANPMK
jgi:mono/diheme cytochrome c family protein